MTPTPNTHPPAPTYDAYLFDIDGTLITSQDAVHYFAFCEALTAVAGRPVNLDGVVAHGNVDVGILRDAWTLAGVPEEHWRSKLPVTRAAMCAFVEANRQDLRMTVLPGVPALLTRLRAEGAVLAVATGNLRGIGEIKLRVSGLLDFFDFGGYSDAFEYRRDVFAAALAEAKRRVSAKHPGRSPRVCVVGDTPEDVRAAKLNGLDVIAVATGIYPLEQLAAEQPTRCVHNLTELL